MGDWKKAVAVLEEMEFPVNCNTFEEKLIAQKTICLLQLKGMNFDYPFGMYVRGAYAPSLTQDYYDHREAFQNLRSGGSLSAEETAVVRALDTLFEKSPSLLEIGATYAFLVKQLKMSPVEGFRIIKETKGFYRDSQIARGISKAKQFLFEPTENDLEWLKKETGPMQRASLQSLRH